MTSPFDVLLDFGDSSPTKKEGAFDPLGPSDTLNIKGREGDDSLLDVEYDEQISPHQNGTYLKAEFSVDNTNPLYEFTSGSTNMSGSDAFNPMYEQDKSVSSNPLYDFLSSENANGHDEDFLKIGGNVDLLGTGTTTVSDDSGVTMETSGAVEDDSLVSFDAKENLRNEYIEEQIHRGNEEEEEEEEEEEDEEEEIVVEEQQWEANGLDQEEEEEQIKQEPNGEINQELDAQGEIIQEDKTPALEESKQADEYQAEGTVDIPEVEDQKSKDEPGNIAEETTPHDQYDQEEAFEEITREDLDTEEQEEIQFAPDETLVEEAAPIQIDLDEEMLQEQVPESSKQDTEPAEEAEADTTEEGPQEVPTGEVEQGLSAEDTGTGPIDVLDLEGAESVDDAPLICDIQEQEAAAMEEEQDEVAPAEEVPEEELGEKETEPANPEEVAAKEFMTQQQISGEEGALAEPPSTEIHDQEIEVKAPTQEVQEPSPQQHMEQARVEEPRTYTSTSFISLSPVSPTGDIFNWTENKLKEEDRSEEVELAEEYAVEDSGSHAQHTFHQNGYTEDEEPQRDPDVFRETKEKEEIHFAEMGSVRQRFESGKSDSSGSPKRRSIQEEYAEAEGGEYENEPVRDSLAVREGDTDTSAELPETGKTKSLLEKFKQIQSTDTTQSGRKPSPPKETGPVEYVSEPRAQIERYEGKSEEGIFESHPQTHEGIIKSGEKLQDDPLPEKGYAKNIANRYKEMDGKKTDVVTREKKELTPDPTGKVEYVSEPRSKFDAYEGKPESGIFESKPHQEEDVVKSDAPVEDILPEKGAAKSILSKFKEIENEGKNKPPPSPSKRLTPDRSGKVEYVSEPRTVVEKYEPKVDAGVFENKPAAPVEVVRSEDQVEDILPEKGYAKNVKERFLEIQRSSVSPTTPGKTKEFTPPRETSPGKTVSGVLESTPTQSNLPKYSEVQELELPQKGMAKTVASKFKQMESPSASSQPRTKKEFTPPKEAGVYESTPVKSLVVEEQKPESGILESRPQEKRADIAREADTVESDLPEPGLTKNLTSKWKQLESESASNKGTKSVSPKCKEFTPPREDARVAEMRGLLSPKSPKGESGHVKPQDLPGQYQEKTQPVLYENEPVHNDNIAREDQTDWTEGMPAKDTTKTLLNKFKSIQEQAKESEETPKPVSKKEITPPDTPPDSFSESDESGPKSRQKKDEDERTLMEMKRELDATNNKLAQLKMKVECYDNLAKEVEVLNGMIRRVESRLAEQDEKNDSPGSNVKSNQSKPVIEGLLVDARQRSKTYKLQFVEPLESNTMDDKINEDKGLKIAVQTEKCAACQKTVYAMEKMEMDKNVYHKSCFKCSHCSARLTPKTFSINEGVMYCTNHFTQLFRRKGNYDEGFGRQPHKKKWSADSALDEHEAEKASA